MVLQGVYMGGGIDYPYWETYNLRAVFPALQDKLTGFPVATVYNQIVMDWKGLRPSAFRVPFTVPDLQRKIHTLYGAYLVALSKGAAPYELHPRSRPAFQTAAFLTETTGIDRQTVVAFLSTLEKLAKAGRIDLKYYAPDKAIAFNKAVKKKQAEVKASEPETPLSSALDTAKNTAGIIGIAALALVGLAAFSYIKK